MDEYEEYVLQEIAHEYAKVFGEVFDNASHVAGVGCVAKLTNATGRLG